MKERTVKIIRLISLILHLLVGVGAMAGGLAAILNPDSPMGMPVSALKNSPFTNFLIPGLFLFIVIGLGNVICAILFRFRLKYQGYVSGMCGGILALWIVIQCIMLWAVVALHVIFFVIGIAQGALALLMLYDEDLFPMNIVRMFFDYDDRYEENGKQHQNHTDAK